MTVASNILESIGNTPIVQLQKVVPPGSARVLVKLEGTNPTANMKDRMAKAAIEAAETDGRLKPGSTVVEYTGGSTGASLALVCAAKGYNLKIVTSDAFSEELSGKPKGSHKIEGIGIGYIPPCWKPDQVDEILSDTTEEAIRMCRRLAREEGIFAGTSSGLNALAALRIAERLGPDATVVTLMVDSGLRYLSTDLYQADQ